MGLNEIGINLQSFLEMLDGGGDVTGMEGFLGALEFFEGFGGDADWADGDRVGGMGRRGSGIGFETRANGRERIGGIEGGKAGVGCARLRSGISPGLRVKIRSEGKREENKDRWFHVATSTVSMNQSWLTAPFLKRED